MFKPLAIASLTSSLTSEDDKLDVGDDFLQLIKQKVIIPKNVNEIDYYNTLIQNGRILSCPLIKEKNKITPPAYTVTVTDIHIIVDGNYYDRALIEQIITDAGAAGIRNVFIDCFSGIGGVTGGVYDAPGFKVIACLNHYRLLCSLRTYIRLQQNPVYDQGED